MIGFPINGEIGTKTVKTKANAKIGNTWLG